MFRTGLAGDDAPRSAVPTNKVEVYENGNYTKSLYGDDIYRSISKENIYGETVVNGNIVDFDGFKSIYENAMNQDIGLGAESRRLLFSVRLGISLSCLSELVTTMFEDYQSEAFNISFSVLLGLYCSGRTNGISVDMGHDITDIVALNEGNFDQDYIKTLHSGGREITYRLSQMLKKKYPNIFGEDMPAKNLEIVRDIKEKLCTLDPTRTGQNLASAKTNYELPDGEVITLDNEMINCPKICLQKIGFDGRHIDNIIADTIFSDLNDMLRKGNEILAKDYQKNIVLSGGNSMFDGIQDLMQGSFNYLLSSREVNKKMDKFFKIICSPERKYAAWIGGSILSSLSTWQTLVFSRAEYEESGIHGFMKKNNVYA